MYDSVYLYTSFLFAGIEMMPHTLEQEIGEEYDGSRINNLKTLHPGFILVLAAVRGKYILVCNI